MKFSARILSLALALALALSCACPALALESQEEREKIQSFTGTAGDSSLKLYTSKATALYSAMGQLAEAAMAGTDYTAAFDAAADALNGMVDQYNRVI